MNIVMVTERYVPIWGGAENQLRQLAPHIAEKGCMVNVVTRRWRFEWPRRDQDRGTKIIRLGIPGSNCISTVFFICCLVGYVFKNRREIDVLHSHGAVKMGALCSLLARCLDLRNVAKIATAGHVAPLQKSIVGRLILKLFLKSDAIIAMTDEICDELRLAGADQARVYKITNGVDCERFSPSSAESKCRWRAENNLPVESIIVLFSGRIVHRKGLDIILASWPFIVKKSPTAHLFILGSGATQVDSVEQQMKQKVVDEKLANVHFLGASDKPEEYLQNSEVFVFPSRIEGFPNALMEAMATGLPIISSKIGGVASLIIDKETGVLFESGNAEELTACFATLSLNMPLSRTMGKAARKKMLDNYSFEKIGSDYVLLYKTLLGRVANG